jgi:hypothetical protein
MDWTLQYLETVSQPARKANEQGYLSQDHSLIQFQVGFQVGFQVNFRVGFQVDVWPLQSDP